MSVLHGLLQSQRGTDFLAACEFLNCATEQVREPGDLRSMVNTFLQFFVREPEFVTWMKRLMMHGTLFVVASGWSLTAAACVTELEQWVNGFPADNEIRRRYPEPLRHWLRNPGQIKGLVEGIACMFEQRFSKDVAKTKKRGWEDKEEVPQPEVCGVGESWEQGAEWADGHGEGAWDAIWSGGDETSAWDALWTRSQHGRRRGGKALTRCVSQQNRGM